jgi:Protein of unknown function (DUF1266)
MSIFTMVMFAFLPCVAVLVWFYLKNSSQQNAPALPATAAKSIHPQPIESWVRMACVAIDGGTSWIDSSAQSSTDMLRNDWDIVSTASLDELCRSMDTPNASAWDHVRVMRVLLAGANANYVSRDAMWARVTHHARLLQRQHANFEEIWHAFLSGKRAWLKLPADGSGDTDAVAAEKRNLERWRVKTPLVAFASDLSARH